MVTSSSNNKNIRICIIGAGLAGTMMAILLAKLGYRVTVYEKREDPRVVRDFLEKISYKLFNVE